MGIYFDFWPIPRPMTKTWGSGKVWERLCENVATPDVAFGKTDGIPEGVMVVDKKAGIEVNAHSLFISPLLNIASFYAQHLHC